MRARVEKEEHSVDGHTFSQWVVIDTLDNRVLIRYATKRRAEKTADTINQNWSDTT